MKRDKFRPLYRHLADGNGSAAVRVGDHLIQELKDEMAAAKKQIALLEEMLAPYREVISEDGLSPAERGERIRHAALTLARRGRNLVSPADIVEYLREEEDIALDVRRPHSVIASVLAKMKEFEKDKTGPGRFTPKPGALEEPTTSSEAAGSERSAGMTER